MKKQKGFTLIEILIVLAVLIVTLAGGVMVWKQKVSPTPTPTLQILPTPTVIPTWTQSCASDNDCPKQFCQPPDKPCAQYYCIQGRCQLVEPPVNKKEEMIGSLNEEITLTPGQIAKIANTNLSLTLLSITSPQKNCFDCPTTAVIEARTGNNVEKITFIAGVLATEEVAKKLRNKEVFGFKITLVELREEFITLMAEKL